MNIPNIPRFFANKTIFITGGSGFIGMVLIEKLLRSCPEVKKIYVLLRSKKGKTVEERKQEMLDSPLFKLIKQKDEKQLKKIVAVEGDASKLELGLSEDDVKKLLNEVNIIYHSAASVRFDDHLKDAILMNTRSTRELINLGLRMRNLINFTYISTAYCHVDREVTDEILYPPHGDWRDAIRIAEEADSHIVDILTEAYTDPYPNTYTFTKQLSEHVVKDLCKGKVPAVIFRPSIVISTFKEPIPGWVNNFNGPVGLCIATGKGVLRSVYTDPNLPAEYVPVDLVVKALLVSTWKQCVIDQGKQIDVYNCTNNGTCNISYAELMELGDRMYKDYPLDDTIWYPENKPTNCWYYHFYKVLFYQLLPALLIDGVLKLTGKKPKLFKIHRKIYIANMTLQYFLRRRWDMPNAKLQGLEQFIFNSDFEAFGFHKNYLNIDKYEFFISAKIGARKYLLNEPKETFEHAKVHTMRMWYLYLVFNVFWYTVVAWFVFVKVNVIGLIIKGVFDMWHYLNN